MSSYLDVVSNKARLANRERVRFSRFFYEFLQSHFSDLEGALAWYARWRDQDEQLIFLPGDEAPKCMSQRAMAYHISRVLEGHTFDPDYEDCTNYLATQYGPTIYGS